MLGLSLSKDTKRNGLSRSREFLSWLAEKGVIKARGNLHTRKFRFKGAKPPTVTFTDDEVKTLFAACSGQLKLHVALALNCGFYPVDVSDLTHDEVN